MRRRAVRWSRAVSQNVGPKGAPPRQPAVVDGDESGAGSDEHPAEPHPDSAAEERVRFSRPYYDVALGNPKPPRSSPHPLTPARRLREPTGPPRGPQLRPEHTLPFATTGPEIPPTVALPVVGQDGAAAAHGRRRNRPYDNIDRAFPASDPDGRGAVLPRRIDLAGGAARPREVRHEAAGQLDTATQVARMERRTGGKHACPAWTDR